ncbi:MAG TPA: flagellar basal body P-ring formation chaperone FlgA [Azonexus sp.]
MIQRAALAGLLTAALPAAAASVDSQVALAAKQFLNEQAARAGWLDPQIETNVLPGNRSALACRQPVKVVAVDTRYPGRMRFAASCPGTDAERREFVVRGEISAEVLVATAALPANRPIAAADLALERRDVAATPDALSDASVVVGQSSRRSLRAGQVLLKSMLVAPVLVKRGEAVRIVARTGPVEVTSVGEALEAGRGDDTVRVRNSTTGKVIRARVTASGTVEPVDLPQAMPSQFPD